MPNFLVDWTLERTRHRKSPLSERIQTCDLLITGMSFTAVLQLPQSPASCLWMKPFCSKCFQICHESDLKGAFVAGKKLRDPVVRWFKRFCLNAVIVTRLRMVRITKNAKRMKKIGRCYFWPNDIWTLDKKWRVWSCRGFFLVFVESQESSSTWNEQSNNLIYTLALYTINLNVRWNFLVLFLFNSQVAVCVNNVVRL